MDSANQIKLTMSQRTLHDVLAAKGNELASMYLGGLHVLTMVGNAERFSQSAQSFRELIQRIWVEYDPSSKKKETGLKEKAKRLEIEWVKIRRHNGKVIAVAEIITARLEEFCLRLDEFFEWNTQFLPRRDEQASRAIANMDPMLGKLPATIMALRVKEFQTIRKYFEDVAHHNVRPESDGDFQQYVDALEVFLLERLKPRTSDKFEQIQRLIQEGESDAK